MKRGDLIEVRWDGGRWKQGTVYDVQRWWEQDHMATLLKVLWNDGTDNLVRSDYVETRLCK
jgi:hypothetical protein